MRVLVTGHNGYIGSVMTTVLCAAGHEVVGLDSFFFEHCTLGLDEGGSIPSLRKDVRDVILEDLQGVEAVVHLAALSNDPLGDLSPEWTFEINHRASVRMAKLAKEAGVQRFLFASSCSMYGAAGKELLTEDAPLQPLTPYALSKVRTEEDLAALEDPSFSPVFMRNATAYGISARLRTDVVLNNLLSWAYTIGKVRIMSDGTPWRPIVHIQDISFAFAAVLAAPRNKIHGQAFNVGVNGENYQVRDLADIVEETVPGCTIEYANQCEPDPRNYKVDFTKLSETLPNFNPQWNARTGAEQIYSAFRQQGFNSKDFQGGRYTRLAQLKRLLEKGRLNGSLRWADG